MGFRRKVKSWFPYDELKSINSGIKKGKLFIMSYCVIYHPMFKELILGPLLERKNGSNFREEVKMKVIIVNNSETLHNQSSFSFLLINHRPARYCVHC